MNRTVLHVGYPLKPSERLTLSGTAPLQWETTYEAAERTPEGARFELDLPHPMDFKVRLDEHWSLGRNYRVNEAGEYHLHPRFFHDRPVVEVLPDLVHYQGEALPVEVFLPPSYVENPFKRYPVVYAMDGQNLFDTPTPTTDVHWHLDTIAQNLMEIGLCKELIIVGVHHRGVRRIEDYAPFKDPHHGGGGAPEFARFLMQELKPRIDSRYRTRPEAEQTAVMGSSVGALFAFYAGRTFPDTFRKVAALSTSLQWDGGRMFQETKRTTAFTPIQLYIDAGTQGDELESHDLMQKMVSELLFDGFRLGRDLYALTGFGDDHSERSWSSRVHFPLSFLFPWEPFSPRSPDNCG